MCREARGEATRKEGVTRALWCREAVHRVAFRTFPKCIMRVGLLDEVLEEPGHVELQEGPREAHIALLLHPANAMFQKTAQPLLPLLIVCVSFDQGYFIYTSYILTGLQKSK